MKKLFGVSLSFCVAEMVRQNISVDDVECISSGTLIENMDQFMNMVILYSETYWKDFPSEARYLAFNLLDKGKIYQCCLEGLEAPNISNYLENPFIEVNLEGGN